MSEAEQRLARLRGIPGLSPAQLEALALLSEECGEVIAIIGKALRHGLDSCHPDSNESNRDAISREAGQVIASIRIALGVGALNVVEVDNGRNDKWLKVGRYLHHIDIDAGNCDAKAKP